MREGFCGSVRASLWRGVWAWWLGVAGWDEERSEESPDRNHEWCDVARG